MQYEACSPRLAASQLCLRDVCQNVRRRFGLRFVHPETLSPAMKMDHPLPVQFAALPYRRGEDGVRVLLVTSRETQRWVLPKGWPIKNLKPHDSAAREAFEEAGLRGKVRKKPIGEYTYFKRLTEHFVLCAVRVYPLEVMEQVDTIKEQGQRQLGWFTPEQAALLVDEPALASLLREAPTLLAPQG